jgi:hypothetical protein
MVRRLVSLDLVGHRDLNQSPTAPDTVRSTAWNFATPLDLRIVRQLLA